MILPDHIAPGLRILFCGTAAGTASARRGHYYAGPGNRFWPLLADTGLTPRRMAPSEDALIGHFGLGLTDLAKTAFGADSAIPASAYAPARLIALVAQFQPRILAFTSLTAARQALGNPQLAAGALPSDPRFACTLWALPSPSALAKSHFSADPWHNLADRSRA